MLNSLHILQPNKTTGPLLNQSLILANRKLAKTNRSMFSGVNFSESDCEDSLYSNAQQIMFSNTLRVRVEGTSPAVSLRKSQDELITL